MIAAIGPEIDCERISNAINNNIIPIQHIEPDNIDGNAVFGLINGKFFLKYTKNFIA